MESVKKDKKGNILTENIIFIILNLVFISILLLFVFTNTGGAAVLEEKYAKQIALIVDSAEPVMAVSLEMEDAIKIARRENRNPDKVITTDGNVVTVQLKEDEGYSYSFFNDVDVSFNFNSAGTGYEIFIDKNE